MRGRPKDPVRARAKATAHARRAHYCTCGVIVHGNGGKSSHAAKHARDGTSNHFVSRDQYLVMFPEKT